MSDVKNSKALINLANALDRLNKRFHSVADEGDKPNAPRNKEYYLGYMVGMNEAMEEIERILKP